MESENDIQEAKMMWMILDAGDDCWIDDGDEPVRFAYPDKAQEAIDEYLHDYGKSVAFGDVVGTVEGRALELQIAPCEGD